MIHITNKTRMYFWFWDQCVQFRIIVKETWDMSFIEFYGRTSTIYVTHAYLLTRPLIWILLNYLMFGWQHLDLKSIDLKCLDLKSIDFKIPCLGLLKEWNLSFEIPLFSYLSLDLDLDLRSIKYIVLIIIFLNPSLF